MAKAKPIRNVDCSGAALMGMKAVLLQRFEEMLSYRVAALDIRDVEGIHAMRVASRRLRSCLRDFLPYLGKRRFVSTEKQMRRIADALGEVRDQDVAILALEKLESQASPPVSATLRELVSARREARQLAHQKLKQVLLKQELERLRVQFETALSPVTKPQPANGINSKVSYDATAQAVIRDRLIDIERVSPSLYTPLDSKALHDMRIAAKRLRYAIELFQPCFKKDLGQFAKMSSRLQSSLGEVHDCDVWIECFGNELAKTRREKQLDHRESLSWVLGHFANIRNKQFQSSLKLWRRWEKRDLSMKLREALKS